MPRDDEIWPELDYSAWRETCATLHLWTQIVGKIRLALTPWINHSWHVTLYLTSRGLTTSPIPFQQQTFEIRFDFIDHELRVLKSDGAVRVLKLRPQTVAQFYRAVMEVLQQIAIEVRIDPVPNELPQVVSFDEDEIHRAYDAEYANRFWRVLVQADRVLKQFRARFSGKCSPVHFFWGSFDLAVTRFSGRRAPAHPGGVPHLPDTVTREAYSHEVSSVGFWPGNEQSPKAAFYSYAYPQPDGFAQANVRPAAAFYDETLREFILPYDAARQASSPDEAILDFAQSTYDAASTLAKWDREAFVEQPPLLHLARAQS